MNVLRILASASFAAALACAVAPVVAHAEETVETTTTKSVETDVVERPALHHVHRHHVRRVHVGCACRVAHRHRRYVRRGVGVAVRGYAPPVVSAAAIAAVDPWSDRAVDGRMVTPPIPGLIHDHDATADYLGKGGNSVPVLHLPSRRGVIDR